jgi:hypothetical protein
MGIGQAVGERGAFGFFGCFSVVAGISAVERIKNWSLAIEILAFPAGPV